MRRTWWVVLVLLALGFSNSASAQGVMFQEFYWDTEPPAGQSWWTHIEAQLPTLAQAGVESVWVPAPYKGGAGKYDMGYGPYDLYDLGSKDQKGTVPTRFGTKDEFLRFVAAAHRQGIKVYADVVLNHANGADYAEPNPVMEKLGWNDIPDQSKIPPQNRAPGSKPGEILRSWTGFAPKGADGKPYSGRFPRGWRDFHPNEVEPDRSPPYHEQQFGQDYAFRGGSDYVRTQMIAWSRWFAAQTGVDGYRLDDLKGIEPDFIADFARQSPPNLWMVGEFFDGDSNKVMGYLHQTGDAIHVFDFPLYFALRDMTFKPETFDMRDLLKRRLPDRERAVMFCGNHDVSRSDSILTYNVPLAYAVMLAMAGTPSVYYSDFWRAGMPLRQSLTRLVRAHNALAQGEEVVRAADKTTLALERRGRLLAVFNSGGDGQAHTVTAATGFGPHARLVDYVGGGRPVTTDALGAVTIRVPPYGYCYYAPPGRLAAVPALHPLPTSQTWEFADDLDTGRLSGDAKTIPITLVKGESLAATVALDGGAAGQVTLVAPDGATLKTGDSLSLPSAPASGVYSLRVRTADGQKAHGTLTVRH